MLNRMLVHFKCRNSIYPLSNLQRTAVEDDQINWQLEWINYNPKFYESGALKGKPWADPAEIGPDFSPLWNQVDGKIDRRSHMGKYEIVDGLPRNPVGRTGLAGRGLLGRWGPNHAADPIVTRWKIENNRKVLHEESKQPILQFCAIQRQDSGQWAIPGGMVDPGETISQTLMREFMEEALNSQEKDRKEVESDKKMFSEFFQKGIEVYKGYVDDPRNTDNAWIETIATNFHDESGDLVGKFELNAGDDAKAVRWMDVEGKANLYANHLDFLQKVAQLKQAHW